MSDNSDTNTASPSTAPRNWLMKLLGIKRRDGRIRYGLNKWGIALWGFVIVFGSFVGFMEYSMQPEFCRSCHIMEPYFQAWHESSHRDVPCGDCHFEPGWRHTLEGKWEASSQAVKFLTGTYGSKPHAEIRDESCLREECHSRRLLEGKVVWPVATQRETTINISFDHGPHMGELRRGKQLRCVSCHSQLVQGQHIVVTIDACFLCHMKGLQHGRDDQTLGGCRSCHDAPKGEIAIATGTFKHSEFIDRGVTCESCHVDAVVGDGAVPKQVCWNCHNKPTHINRYSETRFMHDKHVTERKVECSSCHVQIVHHLNAAQSMLAMSLEKGMASGDCGQCHVASHGGPRELYMGRGGRGVPDMPSRMFMAQVDCVGCHRDMRDSDAVASVTGQTYVAAQASCDRCHGTQYDGMVDLWDTTLAVQLDKAETAVAQAVLEVGKADLEGAERLEKRRLIDDAQHNIRLVKLGHGVHNFVYATALLNKAIENANVAQGKEPPAPEAFDEEVFGMVP